MEPMAPDAAVLCRCGRSATRPFCSRTHVMIGIRAAQKAVRRGEV